MEPARRVHSSGTPSGSRGAKPQHHRVFGAGGAAAADNQEMGVHIGFMERLPQFQHALLEPVVI
jgi:hypothetical protein